MDDELKKQIGVLSQSMYIGLQELSNLKQSIGDILQKVKLFCPANVWKWLGSDDRFFYYVEEDEYISEYPHVHVCVESDARQWNGKKLQCVNTHKCIASVKLRCVDEYTVGNLEFDLIADKKVTNNSVKKRICNWLNSHNDGLFESSEPNSIQCIKNYIRYNPNGTHNAEYIKFVNSKKN